MKEDDGIFHTRTIAAASSGFLVAFLCTPFDVVKNVMQSNSLFSSNRAHVHTSKVVAHIYQKYGITGFWIGINPALGVITTGNVIFFAIYEDLKKKEHPSIAGVKARIISAFLVAPLEFLRTKTQANLGNSSTYALARKIVSEQGIFCFWRGLIPTLVRDIPFSASYWKLNDYFCTLIQKYDSNYENRSVFISKFVYPFIGGGTSAGIACLISHPFDVIKTQIQSAEKATHKVRGYKSLSELLTLKTTKRIYTKEGLSGFAVGLFPRMAKIIPSCAVFLGTYELSKFIVAAEF